MKQMVSVLLLGCIGSSALGNTMVNDMQRIYDQLSYDVPVSASVSPSYVVTIPTEVRLDETMVVSSAHVLTEDGKAVLVSITGTNQAEQKFAVSTVDKEMITYVIQRSDHSVLMLNTPLIFEQDGQEELTFVRQEKDQIFAGDYQGSITFTIAYDSITKEVKGEVDK